MKKIIGKILTILLAAGMIMGCAATVHADEQNEGQNQEQEKTLPELIVSDTGYDEIAAMYGRTIVARKNGKWGMADFDGTILVPFEYDSVKSTDAYDGVSVLAKIDTNAAEGSMGYAFDENGSRLLKSSNVAGYHNGVFEVNIKYDSSGYYQQFLDRNGNVIGNCRYYNCPSSWAGGSRYGVTDILPEKGTVVVKYGAPLDKTAGICMLDKNGVRNLDPVDFNVQNDGKELYLNPIFQNDRYIICSCCDEDEDNQSNYLWCVDSETGKASLLDKISSGSGFTGEWGEGYYFGEHKIWNGKNAEAGFMGNRVFIGYDDSELYTLKDVSGKTVTSRKYSYIEQTSDLKKYYLVCDGSKWFYIDMYGNEYGKSLADAGTFCGGMAIVLENDGNAYIVDENFNHISVGVSCEGVTSYNRNAFAVIRNGLKYAARMDFGASQVKVDSVTRTGSGINIKWTGLPNADGYYIYRSTEYGEPVKIAEVSGSSSNEFTDTGVKNGVTYSYTIGAYRDGVIYGGYDPAESTIFNGEKAGWRKDSHGWWYAERDGSYPENSWKKVNCIWYYFDGRGYMTTGWQKVGRYWYYMDSSGAMKTGWIRDHGMYFYLQKTGAMKTGWLYDDGDWYYLEESGMMKTGWLYYAKCWYYLDKRTGAMKTGWIRDGGKAYYLDENGVWKK